MPVRYPKSLNENTRAALRAYHRATLIDGLDEGEAAALAAEAGDRSERYIREILLPSPVAEQAKRGIIRELMTADVMEAAPERGAPPVAESVDPLTADPALFDPERFEEEDAQRTPIWKAARSAQETTAAEEDAGERRTLEPDELAAMLNALNDQIEQELRQYQSAGVDHPFLGGLVLDVERNAQRVNAIVRINVTAVSLALQQLQMQAANRTTPAGAEVS